MTVSNHPQATSAPTTVQAVLNAMDGVAYIVDQAGVLLAAGPAWSTWRSGNASDTSCDMSVGESLFDGIAGDEVKSVYRGVHHAVLSGERPFVAFDYRCDAPDIQRRLRMSVHPIEMPERPIALLYQSQILSEVSRPWMSLFEPSRILAQISAERGLPIIAMCSFCQRVAWPQPASGAETTRWVEADAYYRTGGPSDVRTSHGVCEDCASFGEAS